MKLLKKTTWVVMLTVIREDCNDDMEKEHEEVAVEDFAVEDVLYALEMMLSFHSWCYCGGPFQ